MQTSQNFRDQKVHLHGLELGMEDLCAGCLITGMPGTGKTMTLLNPLTSAILSRETQNSEEKAACIYFNSKGGGCHDLIANLPESRKKDVVIVSPNSGNRLCLFPENYWPDPNRLAMAMVEFVVEHGRLLAGTEDRSGSFRVYWDAQRDRLLETAAKMRLAREDVEADIREKYFPASALSGFVRRLHLIVHAMSKSRVRLAGNVPFETRVKSLFGDEMNWQVLGQYFLDAESVFRERDPDPLGVGPDSVTADTFQRLATILSVGAKTEPTLSPFELIQNSIIEALPGGAKLLVDRNVEFWKQASLELWHTISGEIQPILGFASSPLATELLSGELDDRSASFETTIDEGKILIIDVTMSDSASSARGLLLAAQFAFMRTLLARRTLRGADGRPMNSRRPVVFVADEFHSFLSSGRNDGMEVFLSQCREFGCISILATQNLRLVQAALSNDAKFSALVALMGTRFFGRNLDAFTNNFSSAACGIATRRTQRKVGMVFEGSDPAIEKMLKAEQTQVSAAFSAEQFCSLAPGEFVCVDATGQTKLVDARHGQTGPTITDLSNPV